MKNPAGCKASGVLLSSFAQPATGCGLLKAASALRLGAIGLLPLRKPSLFRVDRQNAVYDPPVPPLPFSGALYR